MEAEKTKSDFQHISLDDAFAALRSGPEGLTENEAGNRIAEYGLNEVREERENSLVRFLKKFWAPVPWMLEITALLTFILGKYLSLYIIIFLLFFNSFVSYVQEHNAENAVELLKRKLSINARVKRDGQWKAVPARNLVPGDVVRVRLGDIVPADIKIIEGQVLVDQSMLTGESMPVDKGAGDTVFSGSTVKRGELNGLVTTTGKNTYFGRTTELVQSASAESHLEQLILNIVKYLIVLDVLLVVSLTAYSILLNVSLTDILPFSLVVLIASVPVALPVTFTIAMAVGALELSSKGVLVSRLTAVEDAASMDTLCLDKTGTITVNELAVRDPQPFNCDLALLMRYASLASDAASQDPIDSAILDYARRMKLDIDYSERRLFVPFDPSTKRTEAFVSEGGSELRIVKGAPQVISSIAGHEAEIEKETREFSKKGYRTIAVAAGRNGKMEFAGIIPLYDPPRSDSRKFISDIKSLSIKPIMITGDNEAIAELVVDETGIGKKVCRGSEARHDAGRIFECDSFAEVYPEDKYDIVTALQSSGHVTGMTGDGVNDAPALKKAEVGIAVANATDVAKASASIVLTHAGLEDIVEAVRSGRRIYQRMLTYTLNKIIKTLQVAIFLTVSFFIVRFLVTTPSDVILLLFANDFVTMSVATDNVRYSQKPEKWNVGSLVGSSVFLAVPVILEMFFTLWLGIHLGMSIREIQTFVFDGLVFTGQFTIYMVRERGRFWASLPGKYLLAASASDIVFITLISTYGFLVTPVPFQYVVLILLFTFVFMALTDQGKNIVFRHFSV
jgi:H+-transporting ATPase